MAKSWLQVIAPVQAVFPNLDEGLAPRGQLEAVPEPSTLILMGLGLGGRGSIAWRRHLLK